MAMEESNGVQIHLILLAGIDYQRGFTVGEEVASKLGVIFNGYNVFTLGGTQPRDKQTMHLFTSPDKVGGVIEEITRALGLTAGKGFIVQAMHGSQYVPRAVKPPTSA